MDTPLARDPAHPLTASYRTGPVATPNMSLANADSPHSVRIRALSGVDRLPVISPWTRPGPRVRIPSTHSADDFSFDSKAEADAGNARVQAWERLMWTYQQAIPGGPPGAKWRLMERIFEFPESPG